MNKKIILIIIIFGLLAGIGYGSSVESNQYPFIIQPEPPFSLVASTTSRGDNVKTSTLPSIMAKPNSKTYLYIRTTVSCSDINIYALRDNQTSGDVEPEEVIKGQDAECNQTGSFIDTQLIVDSDQTIVLESDEKFTYAAYQGVEGDDVTFDYNASQRGDDNE